MSKYILLLSLVSYGITSFAEEGAVDAATAQNVAPLDVKAVIDVEAAEGEVAATQEQKETRTAEAQVVAADKPNAEKPGAEKPKANAAAPKPAAAPVAVAPAPAVAASVAAPEAVPVLGEVSQGERVSIDGKGFSVVPPVGWLVRKDLPRTSLFIQPATIVEGQYARNISVVRFAGPFILDELGAQKFSEYLVKTFPQSSPEISDYAVRNHQAIQMNDAREGVLFYTDFKARDKNMMQAHVLVSSQTAHYLLTYTDVAEHFESNEKDTSFLTEAWGTLISVELDSPNPAPLEDFTNMIAIAVTATLLVAGIAFYRKKQAGQQYSKFADGDAEEAHSMPESMISDQVSIQAESKINSNVRSVVHEEIGSVIDFTAVKKEKLKAQNKKTNRYDSEDYVDSGSETKLEEDETLPRDQWKVS